LFLHDAAEDIGAGHGEEIANRKGRPGHGDCQRASHSWLFITSPVAAFGADAAAEHDSQAFRTAGRGTAVNGRALGLFLR
jgi:hypothetical protein